MARDVGLAIAVLLIGSVLSAEEVAKGTGELQGRWKLAALEIQEEAAALPAELPIWEIKKDKIFYGAEQLATVKVDSGVSPKSVDLEFSDPAKTYEGVYSVENDTLKICVNNQTDGVKLRPAGLTTKDQPAFRLLVFKRAARDEHEMVRGFVGMVLRLDDTTKKVVIAGLVPGSPAKKADLQDEDVLLRVAGIPAENLEMTVAAIRKVKPGEKLAIALRRGDKEQEVTVKAGVFPFRFLNILD